MDIELLSQWVETWPGFGADFPFDDVTMAWRVGGKIFALTALDETPLRMNLKCDPHKAIKLRAQHPHSILPGYHSNKKHWNTLVLDGSLPPALVKELIAHSYELVYKGLTRKQKQGANLPLMFEPPAVATKP
jgi:predicted DNA-binding protein (MmcQ/YjbR family)